MATDSNSETAGPFLRQMLNFCVLLSVCVAIVSMLLYQRHI